MAAGPRVVGCGALCRVPSGYSVQKTTLFSRKLNKISENISSLNLPQSLRYNRLKLHFFCFLNVNFSKYSRAKWVK